MYEAQTFEVVIARMLAKVTELDSTIDTREGSVIYNALAPAAVEVAELYGVLDSMISESFADTQTREFLILRAAEQGITPTAATAAIMKGIFNIAVSIGDRFKLNDLVYVVTELIDDTEHSYKLTCETTGIIGHASTGSLISVEYIDGLSSAEITEILVKGEDEEATEDLRERYFAKLEGEAFGGNEKDYKTKVNQIQGVGGLKVYRATETGGVFDIYFIDSDYNKPNTATIEYAQAQVDAIKPVGHVPTLKAVTEVTINVNFTIQFQDGYTWASISSTITTLVSNYLKELRENWADLNNISVRVSQLEVRALEIEGIVDIPEITINSANSNLILGVNEIPILGSVTNG